MAVQILGDGVEDQVGTAAKGFLNAYTNNTIATFLHVLCSTLLYKRVGCKKGVVHADQNVYVVLLGDLGYGLDVNERTRGVCAGLDPHQLCLRG